LAANGYYECIDADICVYMDAYDVFESVKTPLPSFLRV